MIEFVPNVSEGRDGAIIETLGSSITGAGCRLLDIHSDRDHHRSVFTAVGNEQSVIDGAVALVERAMALIDLREHRGIHPRIGAVDVIPFIPLAPHSMTDCVHLAKQVGRMLAERYDLPVFLYGAAAQSEGRASLPWIRRGGLAGLAQKLSEVVPDFGPRHPHPTAGAVAVGARPLLVAYNVVLATSEVATARRIAANLREANGGLPGVKALGLMLNTRNLAQVSMNLTDVVATSIPAAFHAVEREAKRCGVGVLESEIVGLVPRVALGDATAEELALPEDPQSRVLETRLAGASP